MATSPPPSSSTIPPTSSSTSPPPPSPSSSLSPPPSASPPSNGQPNSTSEPPASLNSSNPPPPSTPPPISNSPPPSISPPPPTLPTSPPPSTNSPPPASQSPPPPTTSPPPSSAPPPPPALTPPPPVVNPPSNSPSPPSLPTSPPPTPSISSPPPVGSPPSTIPPPSRPLATPPPKASSPPPPSAKPPATSPPSPVSQSPPPSVSQTPPSPVSQSPPPSVSQTPPSPVSHSPPPLVSQTPPSNPLAPPPKDQPPSVPTPPSPPPHSSSNGAPPSDPSIPSPPIPSNPPPLPSPNTPSSNLATPDSPSGNKSSNFGPNITAVPRDRNPEGGGGMKTGIAVPIAVVTGLLVLSFIGLAVWYVRKPKRRAGGYASGFVLPSPPASSQLSESSYPRSPTAPLVYHSSGSHGFMNSPPDPGLGNSKSWFSYEELYKITNGFSDQNLLGEGGFGCVYKGCLPDGRVVAVKQLKVGGSQGEREFRAEVEIISRVHHRHLVSLVGYCISDNQRLLVYDYVPNNTLHYHLHAEGRPAMDWATRVKVAAGAARGIAYLHEDCHPRIIHRDIKSSNILLDNNFEAQVSDFGLARLAMDAATHVTTRVMGTFGYLAPEYASSGKLTEKSDVYSFGVILLELITGRKPVDTSQPLGDESLVEWARPLLTHALETGEFEGLPDSRLEKNYNEAEMLRMIEAAAACIRHSAAMRPRMGLVVRALDSLAEIDLNNGMKPGQSELFHSAQSAEIRLFQRMAFGSQDYSSDFSRTSWMSQREL